MKVLRHLKRLKADVALLQESHLEESDFFRMQKLWVGEVLGSAAGEIRLTNIYAPNSPDQSFFTDLSSKLVKDGNIPHIVGGDFNSTINQEDRSSPRYCPRPKQTDQFTHLYHMVQALNLIDIWRLQHPLDKEYSFFSPVHQSFARLDYILCTHSILHKVGDSCIHDLVISDHSPVIGNFRQYTDSPRLLAVEVSFIFGPKCKLQGDAD